MKSYLSGLAVLLFVAMPLGARAQEQMVVPPEEILEPGDPYVETSETTILGEPTSDGSDPANVINPNESNNGKVQVKMDPEGYIEVYRSGALVERIPQVQLDSGCISGLGQIGEVSVCGDQTKLRLLGRPEYNCPAGLNGVTEPCGVTS